MTQVMTKRSEQNRIKIIAAARAVASRHGLNNTTLQLIADEAGISKGALYYYYKTKDDILYDIMELDNVESRFLAKKIEDGFFDKDEAIGYIIDGVLKRIDSEEKNRLNLYLQGEALQGNKELQERYRKKYEEWVQNIEIIMSSLFDLPKDAKTRTFSATLLAAIEGMCIQKMLLGEVLIDKDFVREIGELLMRKDFKSIKNIINSLS